MPLQFCEIQGTSKFHHLHRLGRKRRVEPLLPALSERSFALIPVVLPMDTPVGGLRSVICPADWLWPADAAHAAGVVRNRRAVGVSPS